MNQNDFEVFVLVVKFTGWLLVFSVALGWFTGFALSLYEKYKESKNG